VFYNNLRALSILIVIELAIFPKESTGISCYDCEYAAGNKATYCSRFPSETFNASAIVDYRKVPVRECDPGSSNTCYKTTEQERGLASVGCLPNYELECIRKYFPYEECFYSNKYSLQTVTSCLQAKGYTDRFSRNRPLPKNETWGQTCICNSSLCNRYPTTFKIKECYFCEDGPIYGNCLTPEIISCPTGYCETTYDSDGEVEERGCVKTELWGTCIMEFGSEGCYETDNRTAVSESCWKKYSFDPNRDINHGVPTKKYGNRVCICDKDRCNDEGIMTPTSTSTTTSEPLVSTPTSPIYNPQGNTPVYNTGVLMNLAYPLLVLSLANIP